MSTTDLTAEAATGTGLPEGSWRVDPAGSELSFSSRGTFGLVPVHGSFREYEGEMAVADGNAHGELRIESASLDTGLAMRDKHLRSPDFFDTDIHKTLTFRLLEVSDGPGGLTLRGVLRIKDTELELTAPLQVQTQSGETVLSTELDVDRAAAGVGWSRAGMIKGPAKLAVKIALLGV